MVHWRFEPARVLIVDDGDENRELLELVLAEAGLETESAANGALALDAIVRAADDATWPFDLVLMDMQMPVMDGFEATRALRERGFTVPVIALTAHAMKGYEATILAAGCSAYLTKPVDIDRLLDALADYLQAERFEAAASPAMTKPAVAKATADSTVQQAREREAPIVSRLAGQPRLVSAARRFAMNLPPRIEAMRAAASAGALDELASLAHWLKGSAGTTGFDDFTEPAARLEHTSKAGDTVAALKALATVVSMSRRISAPSETTAGNEYDNPAARPVATSDEPVR